LATGLGGVVSFIKKKIKFRAALRMYILHYTVNFVKLSYDISRTDLATEDNELKYNTTMSDGCLWNISQ